MKKILLIITIISLAPSLGCSNKEKSLNDNEIELTKTTFDSIAAKKYGADKYGMKKYVIAFLKEGPNRDRDSVEAQKLQKAHMENIGKMAEEGKLVLAGPFLGKGDLRGIYIFDVSSIEEAVKLTSSDPAIQAGSLVMELREWYGSAAVMAINDIHETLYKSDIIEGN